MLPRHLYELEVPSDPRPHPTNGSVAFVLSGMEEGEDRYHRRIWLHDGRSARAFTAGPGDTCPRWSPDGRWLAFLRAGKEKDSKPQLALMAVDGGEAEVLTSFDLGVEYVAWSPDGRWLLVVAGEWAEGWGGLADDDRARKVRRITRYPYRFESRGWLHDRRRHLWLIDPARREEARCLTQGEWDDFGPTWSPDGRKVAFLSDRSPRGGLERGVDAWEVEIEDGAVSRAAARGGWASLTYHPDGRLCLIGEPSGRYPAISGLWRRESDGGLTDLTGHLDRSLLTSAGVPPNETGWQDGRTLMLLETDGRLRGVAVGEDGTVDELVGGDRLITSLAARDGHLYYTASSPNGPGVLLTDDGHGEVALWEGAFEGLDLRPVEHWRTAVDGVEIDCFAVLPAGEGPFPVLLNIHGGPMTQYGFGFFDEFQVYAGAGFGVIACNPRGSAGRGIEFARAVTGEGWGKVDLADIIGALESALERYPQLDRARLGIMGGSYGGFLTAWTIGHDHRFASAVVERALLSFESFHGTSDIGPEFNESYALTEDHDELWALSPMSVARQIETPTLILHSENDFRCPIEQAEQLFVALLAKGVEVEFLRFPGESHELSRSGKPKHRVERFEAIIDWHLSHLT
ncbi:MAG TPA: S9 family peptidase [Acidimicrobiia bacterium]